MKCIVNGVRVPVVRDDGGVVRFRSNRIVRHLLSQASSGILCDLNAVARMAGDELFSDDEMMEFYRLIGYSVDGFQDVFPDADVKCVEEAEP